MKISANSRLSILIFMTAVIMVLAACGGGGGDSTTSTDPTPVDPTPAKTYPTGNQDFRVEDGENADPLNAYRVDDPDSNILPSSVDYSLMMPVVLSQGNTSSCTSWALGYYAKSFQEAVEEEWDVNLNKFSPMYLYAMQCRSYSFPWSIEKAWKVLNHYGCAKWSTIPFQYRHDQNLPLEKSNYANAYIPESAHEEARFYRSGEMTRLYNLNQVKHALTRGPVVFAIDFYDQPPEPTSPEENYMRYNSAKGGQGHAILCVGYDDAKFGTGALKFVNSWGSQWAMGGYSWIRYPDASSIINFAMNFRDIRNPTKAEEITGKPDPPNDVSASFNAGPYVDIDWTHVRSARYYRIFRARAGDSTTYEPIGVTYQAGYRDYPLPGITHYYSVVSVNEFGESEHYAADTNVKSYVGDGAATGQVLTRPRLRWISNNSDGSSNFSVSNISSDATAMEVVVSIADEGPWYSLGSIRPQADFKITWGDDSEFVRQKPYVRVRVTSPIGYSMYSDAAQIGDLISSDVEVAAILSLTATPADNGIQLRWTTDGGSADYFAIYRYLAAWDQANDWILLGYAQSADSSYIDTSAVLGMPYYYGIIPVFSGTPGTGYVIDESASIPLPGANLFLYNFNYFYGQLTNPVSFGVTIWNNGNVAISDYSIGIYAYDITDDIVYLVNEVNASDFAPAEHFPLPPGYEHTIIVPLTIPNAYANGHYYSWAMMVDHDDVITEVYEDDNHLWSYDIWWLPGSYGTSSRGEDLSDQHPGTSETKIKSTRPFSKGRTVNKDTARALSDTQDLYVGPIRFRKPDFNNNHSE
jgi:hypothetical protein